MSGDDDAIFRVGIIREHCISLQYFKHTVIFRNHVHFRKYILMEILNLIQNGKGG